jgi:putative transcriptional regulator
LRCCASAALLAWLLAAPAAAQQAEPPNAVLLVAKPSLVDPNFRETVVLVTQTADAHTVGVILNRPTDQRVEGHDEPVSSGGPVLPRTLVALFESAEPPPASAFPVLKNIWLSMHPDNIEALRGAPAGRRVRLFAGFSGWSPGQLESELARDGWFVLPASESVLFRKNTRGLWQELMEKARQPGRKTLYFFP